MIEMVSPKNQFKDTASGQIQELLRCLKAETQSWGQRQVGRAEGSLSCGYSQKDVCCETIVAFSPFLLLISPIPVLKTANLSPFPME